MVHVAYIITRSEHGGAQTHLLQLIDAVRSDFTICVLTGEEGIMTNQLRARGINTYILKSLKRSFSPYHDFSAITDIVTILRQINPRIVHCHSTKAGIIGRIAANIIGAKTIFTAHGWVFTEGTPFLRRLTGVPVEWMLARFTDRILTVSRADYASARRYRIDGGEKLVYIPNGIMDLTSLAEPGQQPDVLRITMVARFTEQKDQTLLIHASALLKGAFEVFLVGDGPLMEASMGVARQYPNLRNIKFLGTRTDVPDILAQSHILVLATKWEGLPISILEGLRAGLPIVANDVGGIPELVKEGDNGFLTPAGNAQSLAKAIQKLIDNPSLRKTFSENSRELYETSFTLEKMVDQTVKVYESLL